MTSFIALLWLAQAAFAADPSPAAPAPKAAETEAPTPPTPAPEAPAPAAPSSEAPVAPTPAPAPASTADAPSDEIPRLVVGLAIGPAIALSPQSLGLSPRLELGYALPVAGGRVRVIGAAQHLSSKTPGTLEGTPTESGGAAWTLRTRAWMLGVGVTVALLPPERTLVPELSLVPELVRITNRVDGTSGGASIGETIERETRFGARVGAGARYAVGPGEAFGALELDLAKYAGQVPGPVSAGVFAPRVGYRFVF